MSDSEKIEVLLATYNGARYLRQQIDSIFAQDYANVRVLARDDGSSDATIKILLEYANKFPARFQIMPASARSGSPKGNFLRLLKASTARYVSFADQDDVWLPDKLSRTKSEIDRLESLWGEQSPLLVFTDLRVVDDRLSPLYESFWVRMGVDPSRINRLSELLVQSVVTGCTALLNRPLVQLSLRMPDEALLHDRWIALLASTLGKSAAVKAPTVLYRQHDRNAVGIGRNSTRTEADRSATARLRRLSKSVRASEHAIQWEVSQLQAKAFLKVHGAELSSEKRDVLNAYLRCQSSGSYFIRIATWIRYGFFYKGLLPNLLTALYLFTRRPA